MRRRVSTAKKFTFGERDGRFVGIDGVENTFVADLSFGHETDLRAEIRRIR